MKLVDEFRDVRLAKNLTVRIKQRSVKKTRLMEFCGSHTVAIFKHGIRQLLPPSVEMMSGPGCPVCVTHNVDIDKAIALARLPDVILCSFGDMLKVPGSNSSLQQAKAEGADVRIVYSTLDALEIARRNPDKGIVFLGIGFETTIPTIAASVLAAEAGAVNNYYIFSLGKLCPPVMKALLDSGEVKIDGIICPGHVSAIIGSRPYEFIPRDYSIACVVSGFEPVDILLALDLLLPQIEARRPAVDIAYRRSVTPEGNQRAQQLMEQVFHRCPAEWRGVGQVPQSGLKLKDKYRRFDAEFAFPVEPGPTREPKDCRCGEVLRGVIRPTDCHLFRSVCTPERPVGPCMVSYEGACSSYYLYGDDGGG
jgi:hydrogenase expression/formation protein HypD